MRQNVLTGHSDHDHFFSTFEKFSSISRKRIPHMLAEVAKRSEHEKLSYLELMLNLDNGSMAKLSKEIEWTNNYEQQHRKILGYTPINSDAPRALSSIVLQIRNRLNDVENEKRKLLGCDNDMSRQIIGCNVVTRYIYQVNRSQSDHQVFSQIVLAFELAKADKRFVGLNFVQSEDSQAALENFNNQMDMLNYLRSVYSEGHITLHAGELAPGLTTPEALHDHIAKSVRVGQAERIGHGVDIMYENAPYATLHYMSSKGVLVEVCLSSNRLILGTKGENSPLKTYMQFGVPVTLATDDAGVNRSTISQEYQYAIEQVNLTYPEVKKMVRNSLEFSFFEGDSLWSDRGSFISRGSCTSQKTLSEACVYMLERSPKAKLQWQLETDFATFEARYASYFLK